MNTYFFVLGSNPTLSIAELSAVFGAAKSQIINENIFLIETEENINAPEIIKNLGGTIKIGSIINQTGQKADTQELLKLIVENLPAHTAGKLKFGLSYYGASKFHPVKSYGAGISPEVKLFHGVNIKPLGMEIKKYLKNSGISSRWVISREATLSSVVVEQNKLTSTGREIVLIRVNNEVLIGQTLAVQPFKQLSFRDYGRPARDDFSGMLPPKLAQIMINLALPPSPLLRGKQRGSGDTTILDPFCGSGTILTEAMLMGYKNIIGADISQKAVDDTKKNIEWVNKSYGLRVTSYKTFVADATKISDHIPPNSIDAIITEPYLGPPRGKINIDEVIKELNVLYSKSLIEFAKILKPSGRVVMIWPIFRGLSLREAERRSNLTDTTINPNLNNFKIISPIPKNLKKNPVIKSTDRQTIIYGRANQKVWREIVVLEK